MDRKYKIELELGNADSKIYKEQTVEQFGTIQPIKFDKNDVLTIGDTPRPYEPFLMCENIKIRDQ